MSDSFWQLLGYDPAEMSGSIQERRNKIHPDESVNSYRELSKAL